MEKHNQEPLYSISVASHLTGISPRVLRNYEEARLIRPYRTEGKTRLFSGQDVEKIKLIYYLQKEKEVNLSGIKIIFHILSTLSPAFNNGESDQELLEKIKNVAPDI